MKMTASSSSSSSSSSLWMARTIALLHIVANLRGFLFQNHQQTDENDNLHSFVTVGFVLQSDNICLITVGGAFLLALLLNTGVIYKAAACFSILMHTWAALTYWDDSLCDMDKLLLALAFHEYVPWILLAVMVIASQHQDQHQHQQNDDNDDDMENENVPFWKQFVQKQDENESCRDNGSYVTRTRQEVWVRAGHQLDSPSRLLVIPQTDHDHDDKPCYIARSPTHTPTVSPPLTPERLIITKTIPSVVDKLEGLQQNVFEPEKGFKMDNSTMVDADPPITTPTEPMANNKDESASLLPVIHEARELINEMLAKSQATRQN